MSQPNTNNNLGSQAHILLVEDDVSILDISTFILQQNGFAVSAASNGKDALGLLNGSVNSPNPVDLVITDLSMPVMSGVDFIREMRKRDYAMPVVVTTGCLESYSETEIRNIRPDHILFKPFNPANLTYCVKTILGKVQKNGIQVTGRDGSCYSAKSAKAAFATKHEPSRPLCMAGNGRPGGASLPYNPDLNHAQFLSVNRGNILTS